MYIRRMTKPPAKRSRSSVASRASRAKRGYHHGDLRRALVDAAIPILRDGGPEALTLRAVARAAGVSQTAPYRHFADRAELVAAVAEAGFRRLHARLVDAARAPAATLGQPPATARGGLQAIAMAYVRFALEHPAEYRVMFGGEMAALAASRRDLATARDDVFALLRGGIATLQEQGLVRDGDTRAIALTAWALVHGLVMLALDGQMSGPEGASPEELTRTATGLLMFGMAGDNRPR
jgi:AcrR family transcriptional regulator